MSQDRIGRPVRESGHEEIVGLDGLEAWVRKISASFVDRQVILLNGPMGVGKTQFTKILAQVQRAEAASSPTFAIHNQYRSSKRQIDHLDLYRIENEDELESIGFWDLFSQEKSWIVIEWAERIVGGQIPFAWPVCEFDFAFVPGQPEKRKIDWRFYDRPKPLG